MAITLDQLCAHCGDDDVPPGGPCPHCRAPAPTWVPERPSVRSSVWRFLTWSVGVLFGLLCFATVRAIWLRWPAAKTRVDVVFMLFVVAILGGPRFVRFLRNSTLTLLERRWFHPGLQATATTRLGRVLRATGASNAPPAVPAFPGNQLTGRDAFNSYGLLRASLQRRLRGATNRARVDVAVLGAVLGLAGRGRVQLRVQRHFRWSHNGFAVSRQETVLSVEVRRADATPDDGLLESRLLDAMAPTTSAFAAGEAPLPYRASAALVDEPAEAPWVPLSQAILALERSDPRARHALRKELEASLEADPEPRSTEATRDELMATLVAAGAGVGAVLVREIALGFELRRPAAAA